ncbi:MAG: PEP-CTERM sorting domain-containing protein [Nostocales cyanobacterium W4_Combined_metabat2_030]|nr:PEP-CTERM sorting domain-containing protein [Nostocales cyanobacterium W4_Combined_metabat2_030]
MTIKRLPLKTLLGTAAVTLCLISASGDKANAFGVALGNQWQYAADSFTDSTLYSQVGGTAFEIYGMAMRQDGNKISVAINANLGLTGWNDANNTNIQKQVGGVNNGLRNIGWGDLIFNFSGKDKFSDAKSNQLFGVHFGLGNDSGVTVAGLYQNITVQSVTAQNSGWGNFTNYNNYVKNQGGVASLGDLAANTSYFNQSGRAPNSIASGTKVANDNFTRLDASALSALGLNFQQGLKAGSTPIGNQTIGFSFNKTEGMNGNFIASLFAECGNDGIVAKGESVPEPTTIMGTIMAGFGFVSARMRKRAKVVAQ